MRLLCLLMLTVGTLAWGEEPKIRVFEGQITDQNGNPIERAAVEWGFFTNNRDDREVFRSDDQGRYRVETTKVGPDYRLGVSAAGFAPQWVDGLIPKLAPKLVTHDFKLGPAIELRGTVTDDRGEPISDATVISQSESTGFYSSFSSPTPSFPFPGPTHKGITDSTGRFVIRNLPLTTITDKPKRGHPFALSIKTPTGRMPRITGYSKKHNELKINRSYLVDVKEIPSEVQGRVLDDVSGEAITQFKVVIRHRPEMLEFIHPNGEFELKKFSVGRRYQIFVYAENYAPSIFRPTATVPGQGVRHECRLTRSPSLRGVVVDSKGMPVRDAEIVVGVNKSKHNANRFYWGSFKQLVDGHMGLETVQRMTTGADGRFAFCQADQPGVLGVIAPGYARRFIPVADRGNMMNDDQLQVTLHPEAVLTGVVKLNGEIEPDANLRLSRAGMWDIDFGELRANEQGRFRLEGLVAGEYVFSVYQNSGNTGTVRLSRNFTLTEGQTLDVTMDQPDGVCTVTGSAMPFSLITAYAKSPVDDEIHEYRHIGTIASPEGRYLLKGLRAGKYDMRAVNPSVRHGFHQRSGGSEIEVDGDTTHDFISPIEMTTIERTETQN